MAKYLLVFTLFILARFGAIAQVNIYVSTTGDDHHPGTVMRPLKTLEAALNKVATAPHNKVQILLRKGTYPLEKTVEVTPRLLKQHELEITAYQQEEVTLSGAIVINANWKVFQKNIFQTAVGKGLTIDQIFCNGTPLPLARYPNYDSGARVFHGTANDAISAARITSWANPTGAYVHALHQAEWGDFHYRVTGKSSDSLILEGGWQNNRPADMHKEYRFVEGVFEELDTPGEWFYNSESGMLFLYPPAGVEMSTAQFGRSTVNDLIRLTGSEQEPLENVTISHIRFTGTNRTFMLTKEPLLRSDWTIYRGGAILAEGTRHITISHNTFSYLGGHAVFVSKYNREARIAHNHIHHIGGNALAFVGDTGAVRSPAFKYESFVPIDKMDRMPGPKTNNYPADCIAYDNLIHDIGLIEKQVAGVQISMAMDITVSHNSIYQVPRSGVNIGDGCWGGHTIEFNDIFKTVLETGDHGAFNSWGRDRFWLPGINDVNKLVDQYPELPVLDVVKPIVLRNNRFQCEHGWDIDLDDGSSNYHIYNNVCLNGGLKLREGYYRVVTNNVLVNNTFHPHVWYKKSEDVFAHNIVTAEYAPIRVPVWGRQVDSNFFIQHSALAAAQKNKTDLHSLQGDPMFVDAASGNFSVKKGSGALRVGFRNFPMDQFGVVSTDLKRKSEKPTVMGVRTLVAERKGSTTEWQGATIKNIESLGEQSASGTPDKEGVLIVQVTAGSLAEKNGLEAGDVIRKINGKPVSNVAEMLNALQVIMWQGVANASLLHHQQNKDTRIRLK